MIKTDISEEQLIIPENVTTQMKPTFTIVIPTYNRSTVILDAINSVLVQTFPDFELIVVDDGSQDDTLKLLEKVIDPRLRVLAQSNGGACKARNLGAREGCGQYLTFLDSDDVVEPVWLERLSQALRDGDLAVCGFRSSGSHSKNESVYPSPAPPALAPLLSPMYSGCYALPRRLFLDVGGFCEAMPASQHTEFALRLADAAEKNSLKSVPVSEILLEYRQYGQISIRGDDEAVARSADILVSKHSERLNRNPQTKADFLATGGTRRARMGDISGARQRFAKAIMCYPRGAKHWLRFLLTCFHT